MAHVQTNPKLPSPRQSNPWASLIAGSLAGAIEASITYPTEFVKTQLQLQSKAAVNGSIPHARYAGPVDCAVKVVKERGVLGLYRGLSALVIGTATKAGVRFLCFEKFKALLSTRGPEGRRELSGQRMMLAGLGAGVMEAVLAVTPTETIKTKLIHDQNLAQPKYKGLVHGVKMIIKEEGFGGIYRGVSSVIARQGANSAVRLTAYGLLKEKLSSRYPTDKHTGKPIIPIYINFANGAMAGIITVYATMPLDVVKTRMQALDAKTRYRHTMDCFIQVVKQDGLFALWKGATPRLGRLIFSGGIVFSIYEMILESIDV